VRSAEYRLCPNCDCLWVTLDDEAPGAICPPCRLPDAKPLSRRVAGRLPEGEPEEKE